jgi:Ca-activated chloride channel family protein
VALLPSGAAHASPASAVKAYDSGNFAAAEHDYSKAAQDSPHEPLLQFDAGAAAYKAGDYPQATQSFQASVNAEKSGSAKRLAEQQDAYYNLGNTLYREGQKTQQTNVDDTLATWGRAVKAYDAALQLRTDDPDAKFNRDLVQRKIDALKKQQQEKQQDKQQDKQQQKPQQGGQSQQSAPQKPSTGQQSKPSSDAQDKSGSGAAKDKSDGKSSSATAQNQSGNTQRGNTPGNAGQPPSAEQPPQPGQTQPGQTQPGQTPPGQTQPGQTPPTAAGANGESSPRADRAGDAKQSAGSQLAQGADDQRIPGQMSRAEARELLDSVKDEQQRLPAAPLARSGGVDSAPSEQPLKDW